MVYLLLNTDVKSHNKSDQNRFWSLCIIFSLKLCLTFWGQFIGTEFYIEKYGNCLIKGDIDRSCEVFQNIIENAVKYGDGKRISIDFSEEEGCILISVKNGGCTLSDTELPHIFESFQRGANSKSKDGAGLGLYICRQLMHKMGGDAFAEINGDIFSITTVFVKA